MQTITSSDANKSLGKTKDQFIDSIRGFLNEKLTTDSINLDYFYAEGTISHDFLDINGHGYECFTHIGNIERKGEDNYNFNMLDEDGDDWGVRELADFSAQELVWILEMLEATFDEIEDIYDGRIITKDYFDYDEMDEEE